ncbi:hypothetical protein EJ08DRAFT_582822 [Tothia fuscella]|uniref:LYC1 C-terminal domain-containing protein n=1 Tax=Tothia fuscella TaxID=1048955 RepID=A0A9P4NZF3_9PEZI|nr:hypothetical protein EJ08DRAFT_582822 [Tothia fuscella]
MSLPDKNSPTLTLVHPTEEEKLATFKKNGLEWRGALSLEAYIRREHHLADQSHTKDGGISHWILIDSASKDRTILSSCETYRRRALVARNGKVEEVVSHGIGSVFCAPECRKRGYAGKMMKLLGEELKNHQAKEHGKKNCAFSILYSDIGKKFYTNLGWEPFNSSHIALPAKAKRSETDLENSMPQARPLYAEDLPELCAIDEQRIRRTMLKASSGHRTAVAIIPDIDIINWHHSREEFVGRELHGKVPKIKGAIVGSIPGKRVWCYWTRMFYNEDPKATFENTLHILRLVIEEQGIFDWEKESHNISKKAMAEYIPAIGALFRLAQEEAKEWMMEDVWLWNPTEATIDAVKAVEPEAKVIDRDAESIASLMWYGEKNGDGLVCDYVDWLGNEKYGWC